MTTGLFILRIALGGALALQGWAKLTADGRRSTASYFADIGFHPAAPLALVAGLTELASGLMLISGFGTWLAAAGVIGVLVGAIAANASQGYWNADGGVEYPLVAGLTAVALAFTGAGRFSIDELVGWANPSLGTSIVAVAVGLGSALPLVVRRQTAAQRSAATASATSTLPS